MGYNKHAQKHWQKKNLLHVLQRTRKEEVSKKAGDMVQGQMMVAFTYYYQICIFKRSLTTCEKPEKKGKVRSKEMIKHAVAVIQIRN
jgi:hypothetical protein